MMAISHRLRIRPPRVNGILTPCPAHQPAYRMGAPRASSAREELCGPRPGSFDVKVRRRRLLCPFDRSVGMANAGFFPIIGSRTPSGTTGGEMRASGLWDDHVFCASERGLWIIKRIHETPSSANSFGDWSQAPNLWHRRPYVQLSGNQQIDFSKGLPPAILLPLQCEERRLPCGRNSRFLTSAGWWTCISRIHARRCKDPSW